MSDPLVLVFDVGTQSVKGMLLDKNGGALGSEQAVYAQPYYSLRPNWAEQSPDFYFEQIAAVSRQVPVQETRLKIEISGIPKFRLV